jgi:uracil-DNA glycosylase family 4
MNARNAAIEHELQRTEGPSDRVQFDARRAGADCDRCPLNGKPQVGPQRTDKRHLHMIIVGEAPGRFEEERGVPFIGRSGELLNRSLSDAGLDRKTAHVTNTICCRMDNNEDHRLIEAAQFHCSKRLFRELRELPADVPILTLGKWAARALLGARTIQKTRGFVWQINRLPREQRIALKKQRVKAREKRKRATLYNVVMKLRRNWLAGRTVLPTLHPAFILRSEVWRPVLDIDIDRYARLIRKEIPSLEDDYPYEWVRTPEELRRALRKIGKLATLDVETDGIDPLTARLVCIGIGDRRHLVVAEPWQDDMAPVIKEFFRTRTLNSHNGITFDCLALERYGISFGVLDKGSSVERVEDTMVAHHAVASHLPKSLAHCGSVFCDVSPWKAKAKGETKGEKGLPHELDPEELTLYNAKDVRITALVRHRIKADLEDEIEVYRVTKRVAGLCARMRWVGFRFDTGCAKELARQLRNRKQMLLWEMRDLIGDDDFKPSRAFDLRQVLFTRLKVPLIYPTKTGLPRTGRVVLEQLRHGKDLAGKLSDLVLRWRDADKTLGTYLSISVANDGRVHGDWRIGPVTGRIACRIMTLPRYIKEKGASEVDITARVRECYVAAKGKKLVYFDLSQAEPRVAAYLSGDSNFIETTKGDIHTRNAMLIFPQEAKDGFFEGKEAKEGRGAIFRNIAKTVGLAINYLAEAKTVYIKLNTEGFEITLPEVEALLSLLRNAYATYYRYAYNNIELVKKQGYLRSVLSGRKRFFGFNPKPTEVANFPIQTSIADIMNERLIALEQELPNECNIVAQIHDAAIIETPIAEVENVKELIRKHYDEPIRFPDREPFVIPIDLKVGEKWSDL